MEKINTEILISSLFVIGFDKVDATLYTYILGSLSIENGNVKLFEFAEEEPTKIFNEYIDYDGIVFSLKKGISLETNVSPVKTQYWPLEKALHTNRRLIEYLSNMNFKEIVIKKIKDIGFERIENLNFMFSNKEKDIICEIFGINQTYTNEILKQNSQQNSSLRTLSLSKKWYCHKKKR